MVGSWWLVVDEWLRYRDSHAKHSECASARVSGNVAAGSTFSVTVSAVDSFYNVVSTTAVVFLTSNDTYGAPNALNASSQTLQSGTTIYTATLYSAQDATGKDSAGNAVKFTVPTVANGKIYVGTRTEIDVYGLKPN